MNLSHEAGWISAWIGIYFVPEFHFMMSVTGSPDPQTTRACAVKIRRKKTSYRGWGPGGFKICNPSFTTWWISSWFRIYFVHQFHFMTVCYRGRGLLTPISIVNKLYKKSWPATNRLLLMACTA